MLADTHSDQQRANLVMQLQELYGNAHVQRVIADIQAERGSGSTLEPGARSEMEAAFNRDFGDVRIHTGSTADKLARELHAKAFTTGKDIFFKQGAYNRRHLPGKETLAHELTHVVQQGSAVDGIEEKETDSAIALGRLRTPGRLRALPRIIVFDSLTLSSSLPSS